MTKKTAEQKTAPVPQGLPPDVAQTQPQIGSRRHRAREACMQLLFQCQFQGSPPERALAAFFKRAQITQSEVTEFVKRLACGAWTHQADINQRIQAVSVNWRVARMGAVDLAILRMACFEIVYCDDIPVEVTINEAVELAKDYGDEKSPQFINGILDAIAKSRKSD